MYRTQETDRQVKYSVKKLKLTDWKKMLTLFD